MGSTTVAADFVSTTTPVEREENDTVKGSRPAEEFGCGPPDPGSETDLSVIERMVERMMAEPGVSAMYTKAKVIERLSGLTPEQVPRAKALIVLGVTEEDLSVAQRLLQSFCIQQDHKEERLLGYTRDQRERVKALATLGINEQVLQEAISRVLGSLGPSAFMSGENPLKTNEDI